MYLQVLQQYIFFYFKVYSYAYYLKWKTIILETIIFFYASRPKLQQVLHLKKMDLSCEEMLCPKVKII